MTTKNENPHMKKSSDRVSNCSVGTDCEDVQRWREMMPKLSKNPSSKLFTKREHKYCLSSKDPAPHYAVSWCAKEALLKAVAPFCRLDLREIEVVNSEDGSPFFNITNPRVKKLNLDIRVSLAHSEDTAIAVVLVVERTSQELRGCGESVND